MNREAIFNALFALVSTGEGLAGKVTWNDGGMTAGAFAFTSRRVRLWDDLPMQPALCQAEHDEASSQTTKMPYKRVFTAKWVIYQKAGANGATVVPATANNAILDAIQAAFAPGPTDPGYQDERQTLGGLVYHCFINGQVFKDPGDIDGQGLMIVPINILVP